MQDAVTWLGSSTPNLAVRVIWPANKVPANAQIQHQLLRDAVIILDKGVAVVRAEIARENSDVDLQTIRRTGQK